MSRSPDFQKKEAKQSLWDMDGLHIKKKHRNKGKGRGRDKRLIEEALQEMETRHELDLDDMLNEEASNAWYCHLYGPCERCRGLDEES